MSRNSFVRALAPFSLFAVLAFVVAALLPATAVADPGDHTPADYVILISVDGLRSDAITRSSPEELPNFYRLRQESAFTDNARTDAAYSVTLPNHISQLTGHPVQGHDGHNWTSNGDPGNRTLHRNNGDYVASAYDVVSDHGFRTGAYVSKSKFVLLDQSYDPRHGAPDRIDDYDGRDKIDTFVYDKDTRDLVERFVRDMERDPYTFSFLHLRNPDATGHFWKWSVDSGSRYMRAVRQVDALLGRVLDAVESDARLAGRTTIILTADHGGHGRHHDEGAAEDYTVPFYVWGANIETGDLYALNGTTRRDPGANHPGYEAERQPVRNGDAANLALSLLGLPDVPGSTINTTHKLRVLRASEADLADVPGPRSEVNVEEN